MINLREFWQAAMANLRAIFSARPARPSVTLESRSPMRALPGPVASDEWAARPPRQIDVAPAPVSPTHSDDALHDAPRTETLAAAEPDPPAQEARSLAAAPSSGADEAMRDADRTIPATPDSQARAAEAEPSDHAGRVEELPTEDALLAEDAPSAEEEPPAPPPTQEAMPPVMAERVAELEALLFVAAEPTAPADLARALSLTPEEVETALGQLADLYQQQGRGLRLQRFNDKVQLVTAPGVAPSIERFLDLDSTSRLSGPALETLAVIAYRQPVTRAQIESVRGVDCAGVLRSLLQRGLVAEVGRVDGPGRPILYGVTEHFMQHFGLTALDELPPLEEDETDRLWAATLLAEDEEPDAEQVEERDG